MWWNGIHSGLKIRRLLACGFNSHHPHHSKLGVARGRAGPLIKAWADNPLAKFDSSTEYQFNKEGAA